MKDTYGRAIEYLRVSVTDRCNLRCAYCMPKEGVRFIHPGEILSYEEITRLARIMAGLGIKRVRLTGGEPLVRKDVELLAAELARMPGSEFLGLTTNGALLKEKAELLCKSGVNGVNISVDTLNRERYAYLTGSDKLPDVLAGIHKALMLPFESVRLNCVLSPYSIEEDWVSVAGLAQGLRVDVRLIEHMPITGGGRAVCMDEALNAVANAYGPLKKIGNGAGGPAVYHSIDGFAGRIGAIPAMSHTFCQSCNRVRLTADGGLKTCLFYDTGVQLKLLLRGGADDGEIGRAILAAVDEKPERHAGERRTVESGSAAVIDRPCGMHGIGG